MKLKIAITFGVIFFLLGLATLTNYGVNWDTINHLPRGQVYLHYFLTGHRDFTDLPEFKWYWQKDSLWFSPDRPKNEIPRVSLYQNAGVDFNYFMETDGDGHPPLSDILSAVFNLVLFQKFGLINDVDSYRIYGITLAAIIVGLVVWWSSEIYKSKLVGFFTGLSVSMYPLFWSEAHFNTEKDIPETAFWVLLLFSVWSGVRLKSSKWMLAAGIFFGLALGTKFNVLFTPFIIIPWLIVFAFKDRWFRKSQHFIKKNLVFTLTALSAPFLGFGIFLASWPYLWQDLIGGLERVTKFYRTIGLTESIDPRYVGAFGINTYAAKWIVFTTPIVILCLSIIGLFVGLRHLKDDKDKVTLMFLLWLVVPIARVTSPNATIYGGVRQIMEYIPPLAIFSGLGGKWVFELFRRYVKKELAFMLIFMPFVFLFFKLYFIHPNENAYFNSLVGGLAGAKRQNIPSWGNTFGAAYRQGANWINNNADQGADVVFAYELIPNIPRIWLRTDLNLFNTKRSGYLRQGEYAITLTSQGAAERSYYDMYLEQFLEPVYQSGVDGVSVVKVWKNDDTHLKKEWKEELVNDAKLTIQDWGLDIDLGEPRNISRLEVFHTDFGCSKITNGFAQISKDKKNWVRLPGAFPDDWRISSLGEQPKDGKFIEPFVGQTAQYINIVLSPSDVCLKQVANFAVFAFEKDSL